MNDWGGAVIVIRNPETNYHRFVRYQRGLVFQNCLVVTHPASRDQLICETGHTGQGIVSTAIAAVTFARDTQGNPSADLDMLITASEDVGYHGGEAFDCAATLPDNFMHYYGYSLITTKPPAGSVRITARYLNKQRVDAACAAYRANPDSYYKEPPTLPLPEGHILIRDKKEGEFLLNLTTRQLIPAH